MRIKRMFPIFYRLMTAVTLLALAVGLYVQEPKRTIQPAPDLIDLQQRLEVSAQTLTKMSSALTQLEDKLTRLESEQLQLSKAIRKAPPPPQTVIAHADAIPPDPTEDSFESELSKQGFDPERLQFTAESYDADWSLATEASVLTTLTDLDILDIELDSADCYQSGCQLEFKHLSNDSNAALIEQLQASDAFAGEFSARTITDADGAARTIMVVGRADEVVF